MKAYYAHSLAIYGTRQEAADIKLVESLGFKCINPNSPKYDEHTMEQFCELATSCDVLFFRAFDDDKIGSGVAKEIEAMWAADKPVFELSSSLRHRFLSRQETRARIKAAKLIGFRAYLSQHLE